MIFIKIILVVLLSVAPPLIAFILDPALSSKLHAGIFAGVAITFLLIDRFFRSLLRNYDGLHTSPALTLRESERLQTQVSRIRQQLGFVWWLGIMCRLAHAVLIPVLLTSKVNSPLHFYATLGGYLIVGFSFCILGFFWVSFRRAEKFKETFEREARRELERQEIIEELGANPLVKT